MNHAPGLVAEPAPSSHREAFRFGGNGAEYFRIWIVNIALTLLTLGLYSPWAKVRRLRYFYGNTQLAGSGFEYHGEPLKILKGRLIALAIFIPYSALGWMNPLYQLAVLPLLLIALPFILVKSRRFSMRMTSWRNVRFDFTGTYGSAAQAYLGGGALVLVSFGILMPHWHWLRHRFVIGNSAFGATPVRFAALRGPYWLGTIFAGLIASAGYLGAFAVAIGAAFSVKAAREAGLPRPQPSLGTIVLGFAAVLGILIAGALANAVFKAWTNNEAFSKTFVGEHRLHSEMQTPKLAGIYLRNVLFTLVTLGLYIPWARVNLMRYQLDSLSLEVHGSLDEFVGTQRQLTSATGEELGDLFDIDFGL